MPTSAVSPEGLLSLLKQLGEDSDLSAEVVHQVYLPGDMAVFGELDPPLPDAIQEALASVGAGQLWQHQVEGVEAARRGEDVLVTTPTASGKSLIFQLPILEEAMAGGTGRGLFLFPLKALGQDQRAKFEALASAAGLGADVAGCSIYDGDTPPAARQKIRSNPPRVIITNPDMLHLGILAYWSSWAPFLKELKWIVIDELHTYRGIFGSHFHHVLQRLFRLCRAQGSAPAVIASSATAANAAEFAATLADRPFHQVVRSGAPREGRHLLLLRPSASPYSAALDLLSLFLDQGLKTIVFTKARRITELLFSWLRRREPELAKRVRSYRAGFLPQERRKIEQALFAGEVDGVISTSALEMGIDIGGLDACILVGYPGSVMATWQRSGRVGRAGRESVTLLVAMPDALDQYLLDHPGEILDKPCERLIADPDNDYVARGHLVCAAAERSLDRDLDGAYLERHGALVETLLGEAELLESADGREIFSVRRRPHRNVSLRGTGDTFAVRVGEDGPVIGTVDGARVFRECHPGAVYLHSGRQFLIEALDSDQRVAVSQRTDLDYFTTPLTDKETEILEVLAERTDGPLQAWLGRLKVTERVVGYERKRLQGQESLGQHPLELPPIHFETVGLWWSAGPHCQATLQHHEESFMGGLHASEHATISLLPTFALCDRGDIGGISIPFHPQVGTGAVFIYDGHPGGVGILAGAFQELPALLQRVLGLLDSCDCEAGCPSCVQSPKCGNGNRPLDKAGAARLLRLLLALEEPTEPAGAPVEITLARDDSLEETGGPAEQLESKARDGESAVAIPEAKQTISAEPEKLEPTKPSAKTRKPSKKKKAPSAAEKSAVAQSTSARGLGKREPGKDQGEGTVLFDLETRRSADEVGGWGNSHRMGVAVGVLCFLEENRFQTYFEADVGELVAALRSARLVIGFNSKRFDYRVLNGYTGEDYSRTLRSLDLLEEIHRRLGFRLGLGHLCQETLGADKTADGLQSLEWVRQGRLDLVEEYCIRDVELLRDLYLFGRREGFVLYRKKGKGKQLKLPVDW